MKKVILFVIDALASEVLIPAIDEGRLPNFQSLATHGILREECISIFPSITPASLSSIITGQYPVNTEVPGDYWYDKPNDTVNYIGGDFSAIMGQGLETFVEDFLINLNARFLKADTLFEILERNNFKAACLNFFIHRGIHQYDVELPKPMNLIPTSVTEQSITGPSMLQLGDLHKIDLEGFDFSGLDGFNHRFGFQDDTTMAILNHLVVYDLLPDCTVAYLPDNDWDSHELGPDNAVFTLEHLDELFGKLFDLKGGLQNFLEDHIILIIGDHSQCPLVPDEDERGINLTHLLKDFKLVSAGQSWDEDSEIIACPNLRATLFYFSQIDNQRFNQVAKQLLSDERVDQVFWRGNLLDVEDDGYYVKTAKRGQLCFYPDTDSPMATDHHGNGWSWEGQLGTVDGTVSDNTITFDLYPNAFERLTNILDLERSGDMWATAKPGHTFHLDEMDFEERGSHGALHKLDSTTSLLVAGHDDNLDIPVYPRIIDVAPLILKIFSL